MVTVFVTGIYALCVSPSVSSCGVENCSDLLHVCPVDMEEERVLKSGKQTKAEQRFVIKFFCAQGESPIQIWRRLRHIHGVHMLSQTAVRNWVRRFESDPQSSCLDRARSSGPRTARNPRVIRQVQCILSNDARVTLRNLALQARVSIGSVHIRGSIKSNCLLPCSSCQCG